MYFSKVSEKHSLSGFWASKKASHTNVTGSTKCLSHMKKYFRHFGGGS